MKDQIVDFETSKMLKELGVNIPFLYWWNPNGVLIEKFLDVDAVVGVDDLLLNHNLICEHYKAPLWSQIKEWLWNEHSYFVYVNQMGQEKYSWFIRNGRMQLLSYAKENLSNPTIAEIEGIKKAVEYLSQTAVAVTPNNTKPNSH